MVAPLTPASFYTHRACFCPNRSCDIIADPTLPPLFLFADYGTVLRMQSDLWVSPDKAAPSTVGEWKSMGMSNWLLSASPARSTHTRPAMILTFSSPARDVRPSPPPLLSSPLL